MLNSYTPTPESLVFEAASKQALFQAALHLAANVTGNYDSALSDGSGLRRLSEELTALAAAGNVRKETAVKVAAVVARVEGRS